MDGLLKRMEKAEEAITVILESLDAHHRMMELLKECIDDGMDMEAKGEK